MKKTLVLALFTCFSMALLHAENNQSIQKEKTETKQKSEKKQKSPDTNQTAKKDKVDKQVQEQMKREQKYAKEQTFYQGSDFNLSAFEIDKDSISSVPELEPDYDFDMSSGVYTD